MALLTTDAIVLQVRDYLESSRIVRLATREAGVISAVARGARRQRARSGSALDLFVEGTAHIYVKPTRDLHTLGGFEAGSGRSALATDFHRFLSASALAEVALRMLHEEANSSAYDVLVRTLDVIAGVKGGLDGEVDAALMAGVWQLLATLGFAPALDVCASCHAELDEEEESVRFVPEAGGVLCARCAPSSGGGRMLPALARASIRSWVADAPASPLAERELRAHRRLLREFMDAHATGDRPLRAWSIWSDRSWEGDRTAAER